MDGERPPRRPGGPRDPDPADDPVSHVVVPGDPVTDPDDLSRMIADARGPLEILWDQVDPRNGAPDRFRAAGGDPDLLPDFYEQVTRLLQTLHEMRADLDDTPGAGRTAGARDPRVCPAGDSPGALSRIVSILASAGREVDETDVLNWTSAQRTAAVFWALSESDRLKNGAWPNPAPEPDFLPERRQ